MTGADTLRYASCSNIKTVPFGQYLVAQAISSNPGALHHCRRIQVAQHQELNFPGVTWQPGIVPLSNVNHRSDFYSIAWIHSNRNHIA
jgi:hypothetical protein